MTTENVTIGQLIKQTRESKGISLKLLSQQTKIHYVLLGHLENDELDKLPSRTYVRGFIKAICKILYLDQNTTLEILDQTYSAQDKDFKKESVPEPIKLPVDESSPVVRNFDSTVFLKFGGVLAVLFIIGMNIKGIVERSIEDSQLQLPKVISTLREKSPKKPKAAISPTPIATMSPAPITAKDISLAVIPRAKEITIPKNDITINDITFKSIVDKMVVKNPKMTKESFETDVPEKYRVLKPESDSEMLFIVGSEGDSWITFKVDDKEIQKYVLRKGRSQFLKGKEIRLFIANTKNVNVYRNQKLLDLGPSQQKNLVLPEQNKTKYMAPLFVWQKDGSVTTSDLFLKNPNKETTPENKITPYLTKKETKTNH